MKRAFLYVFLFSTFAALALPPAHPYKRYYNQQHRIGFDIPYGFGIKPDTTLENGLVCVPLTNAGKKVYKDCFEGIIFRISFFDTGLDSALTIDAVYEKEGKNWYTSDKGGSHQKMKPIRGVGWHGLYHDNMCGINCFNGPHTGECENFWLTNGKRTFHIETNGTPLEDTVRLTLMRSVRFY